MDFSDVQSQLPSHHTSLPPDLNPLPSFWTEHFNSPHRSGITGTSAAYQLVESLLAEKIKEKEVRIVILEARDFCSGATGRNGGHLSPSPIYQFHSISEKFGLEDALAAVKLEDRATNWILDLCTKEGWDQEVELTRNGTLHLFESELAESQIRKELSAALLAGLKPSMNFLESEEVLAQYGATAYSGLLIPGNNLYPLKFVSKLFSKSLKDISNSHSKVSLQLYTSTLVNSITPTASSHSSSPSKWTIQTPRGSLQTTYVIHATNAYASYLLPSFSQGPNRIIPTRGQVISVLPTYSPSSCSTPTPVPNWKTGFSANDGFEYYFQRHFGSREIILGGGRDKATTTNFEFGQSNDGEINTEVGKKLRSYLGEQFPDLEVGGGGKEGGLDVGMEWTGIMGFTESSAPIVGSIPSLPNQFISAGYTGHGMSRAPACAEAVSSMVLSRLRGREWRKPDWLPVYYTSTQSRKEEEKKKKEVGLKQVSYLVFVVLVLLLYFFKR